MDSDYNWSTIKHHSGYKSEPVMKRYGWWISLAVLLSVLLHLVLYILFERIHVLQKVPVFQEVVQLSTKRDRVMVEEEKLKDLLAPPEPEAKDPAKETPLIEEPLDDLPAEDMQIDEVKLTPEIDKVQGMFASESPVMPQMTDISPVEDLTQVTASVDEEINKAMREKLLEASRVSAEQPELQLSESDIPTGLDTDAMVDQLTAKAGDAVQKELGARFTGLDDLLEMGDSLPANPKTMVPTDLLFEFNEYRLREAAKLSLMKLGMIIMNNPQATFIIEGHTDSIGTDQSNLALSEKRAEAVRDWLVNSLRMDNVDIRTVAHGESNPLVATTGDPVEEALNRRVEITIRKN